MRNCLLLTVVFLLCIAFAYSQEYGFGVRGGINTYKIGSIVTVGSNGPQGPEAGLVFHPIKKH